MKQHLQKNAHHDDNITLASIQPITILNHHHPYTSRIHTNNTHTPQTPFSILKLINNQLKINTSTHPSSHKSNHSNKFNHIRRDTVPDIQRNINMLIDTYNSTNNSNLLTKLSGHYEPGYLYGNPKIHKSMKDPPLRPIISQIGTPVYNTAKELNSIITPYIPKEFVIDSTYEFIEICKTINQPKLLASLDVESLFTNVPVLSTIDIILKQVYEHPTLKPPDIPQAILKQLLIICTTKCPFRGPDNKLYVQTDGVSMGSPLGCTLANFYMCHIENAAFRNLTIKPTIYCRYVDDCFLVIDTFSQLTSLKEYMEEHSVLKFTYEIEQRKQLAFLDVLISRNDNQLTTSIYTKPTNSGECLNYKSLCPQRYKIAVLRTLLHRAYAVTNTWQHLHSEIERIRKLLINNGFPILIIDKNIEIFINSKIGGNDNSQSTNDIYLYYRNQFTSNHISDERHLRKIIEDNITPVNPEKRIKLQIYYRNRKLQSLFIRNRLHRSKADSRVVYQYNCTQDGCNSVSYIGCTICSLAKRFYTHVQTGAIRHHNHQVHNTKPLTQELLSSTQVLYRNPHQQDLLIAEALLIKEHQPYLNQQEEGNTRVLRIF